MMGSLYFNFFICVWLQSVIWTAHAYWRDENFVRMRKTAVLTLMRDRTQSCSCGVVITNVLSKRQLILVDSFITKLRRQIARRLAALELCPYGQVDWRALFGMPGCERASPTRWNRNLVMSVVARRNSRHFMGTGGSSPCSKKPAASFLSQINAVHSFPSYLFLILLSSLRRGLNKRSWLKTKILDWMVAGIAMVEALLYKPEGRGFNSRCHWNFSLT